MKSFYVGGGYFLRQTSIGVTYIAKYEFNTLRLVSWGKKCDSGSILWNVN